MTARQQNVPVLRFTDNWGNQFPEWGYAYLGDILSVRYGREHKHLSAGDIPVLGTGGIIRYANSALYSQPSVLIGRKGTIDNPQFIEQPFWAVDTLFYTEIATSNVPYFVYLIVLRINWKRYNEATGLPSLNVKSISGIRINIPSKEEQQKIADFLSSIDTRIEQLEKKKSLFEQYKKGLMQKLFSQENRFRDERGEEYPGWAKRRLRDLSEIISGVVFQRGETTTYPEEGRMPVLRAGNIENELKLNSNLVWLSHHSVSNRQRLQINDIVICTSSGSKFIVGKSALLRKNWEGTVGAFCSIVRCKSTICNPKYLAQYMSAPTFRRWTQLAYGSNIKNLKKSELECHLVSYPSLEEQQKIADILSSIERKIELIDEQTEKTRKFKKGLLQQMFV